MTDQYNLRLEKIEAEISAVLPERITREWAKKLGFGSPTEEQLRLLEGIVEPARSLVGSGGKRWRPLLLLLTHELFGGQGSALVLTPIVELVHSGTLMVDDIEDKSDLRRGKPAAHVTFGEDMAINTGNLLYFLPTLRIDEAPLPAEIKLRLYRSYAANLRRLHAGQGMDIQWHKNPSYIPAEEDYILMCRCKTGALARMSAEFGALSASGVGESVQCMGGQAETLGLAFQILDDVKNLTTGNPGKKRGDDIVEGKKSLPVILHCAARPEDRERLAKLFLEAGEASPGADRDSIEEAIALLTDSGSIEKARCYAAELLKQTEKSLEAGFPASEALDLIIGMVRGFG